MLRRTALIAGALVLLALILLLTSLAMIVVIRRLSRRFEVQ